MKKLTEIKNYILSFSGAFYIGIIGSLIIYLDNLNIESWAGLGNYLIEVLKDPVSLLMIPVVIYGYCKDSRKGENNGI